MNLLSDQTVLGPKVIVTEYDPDFEIDEEMSTTRARKRGEKRNRNITQSEETNFHHNKLYRSVSDQDIRLLLYTVAD